MDAASLCLFLACLVHVTLYTLPTELKFYWPPLIDVPYKLLYTVTTGMQDAGCTVA